MHRSLFQILGFFLSATVILNCSAQIPNGGFEQWYQVSQENIQQWFSYGNVSTALPHSGSHAVRLHYDQTYSGSAFLLHGNYIDGIGFVGGVPFTERADSVKGYFRCYSPDPTDHAILAVIFRKNGADLSHEYFFIPVQTDTSVFIERKFKINYNHPTLIPDSVIILITNPRPFQDTVYSGWLVADNISFTGASDQIPNGNFEQWNITAFDQPISWATLNQAAAHTGSFPVVKTSDSFSGNFAVKVETIIAGSDTIPGLMLSSLTQQFHAGAFPLGVRYTSLSGNVKFFPENDDTLSVVMLLYHNDTIAGYAFTFFGGLINQYTSFDVPVYYAENFFETPDSAVIYIAAYHIFNGDPLGNSVAYVDNLNLHFNNNIIINELQSSNAFTHFDIFGDAEDWIELYNAGTSPVFLRNFFLSDNVNNPTKSRLGIAVLEPDSFLIVFASGKELFYPELHTNFKISSQGEDILLVAPTGEILDQFPPVSIPTDVSFGRYPNASSSLHLFSEPTPGAPNITSPLSGYTYAIPVFSHQGGFYTDEFYLTLSTDHPDAIIRYTLDGSEPDYTSTIYATPILVKSRTGDPNVLSIIDNTSPWWAPPLGEVFKSTVIRAKLFIQDTLVMKTATHTYFVDSDIFSKYNVPVISLTTDSVNLFDYLKGIYVKGKIYDDWVADNPNDTTTLWIPANYLMRGDKWERPVHIEFFEKDGTPGFRCDAGLRTHGGASRLFMQKALRLNFRDKYGTESLQYEVFPGLRSTAGGLPVTEFKKLILRTSGNDNTDTFFRDGMIHRLITHSKTNYQDIRPAVVFINGEFWGFHNIRERQDKHYLESHYHTNSDDMHILESMGHVNSGPPDANLHFYNMYLLAENNHLSDTAVYNQMKTLMDINNFIDYQAIQIYIRNTDWPGNNIKYFRKSTSQYAPYAPYGQDGRWRWMLFDTDFGFGLIDGLLAPMHNTLEFASDSTQTWWPNPAWSTLLFRKLLENIEFRNDFINRIADHMNTSFRPHRVIEVIDSMQFIYYQNMQEHINRWYIGGTLSHWDFNVNVMRNFANERPSHMTQHIMDMWNLPGTFSVTFDVSDESHGFIKISSIDINEHTIASNQPVYPWGGKYFKTIPVPVKAIPKPGYAFAEWEGTGITDEQITILPQSDTALKAIFVFDSSYHQPLLFINELMASNVYTIQDEHGEYDDWIEIFNPRNDTLDIAGYYVTDDLNQPHKHQISSGSSMTKIPPGGFLLLWADGQPEQGPLHLSFKLSATGEAFGIFPPDSYIPFDTVTFGAQTADISYGRYPDGHDHWVYFNHPTPGASNVIPQDDEPEVELFVYPVPSNDFIQLSMPRDVRIYTSAGLLVHEQKSAETIIIKHFANGLYFLLTKEKEVIPFIKY